MKKLFSLLVISLFTVISASAQSVVAGTATVDGKTITIPLSLTNASNVYGIGLYYTPSEGLTVSNVSRGTTVKAKNDDDEFLWSFKKDLTKQNLVIYEGTLLLGDGNFANLVLTASDTFESGTVTLHDINGTDKAAVNLPMADVVINVGTTTSINAIQNIESDNAVAYDLAGRQVKSSAKGIIIKGGKKMVNK